MKKFFSSTSLSIGLTSLALTGCLAVQHPPKIPANKVSPDIDYLWPETEDVIPKITESPKQTSQLEHRPIGVDNGIIAVVNDKVITLKEFDAEFRIALQEKSFTKNEIELYNDILNGMIDQILLLDLAYLKEIEITPVEVENEIENMAQRHPQGWDGLRRDLEAQKNSIEIMKERVKESLMLKTLRRQIFGGLIAPSPREIQESYQSRIQQFQTPEKRHISLITLFESDYRNDKSLIDKASEKTKSQIQKLGFIKTLEANSSDGKGDRNNKGMIGPQDLAEPISKVAFELKEQSWSGPHRMPGVTFFVHCGSIQEKRTKSMDEVLEQIKGDLIQQERIKRVQKAIQDIKSQSYIKKLNHLDYIEYRKSRTN